jgi:hypothetical protein
MPQAQRGAARTAQAHLLPSDIDNPVAPECTNSRNIQRADQQIYLLSKLYPGRVRTVVFENRANVNMSWYLTAEERSCLAEELGTEWNEEQLRNLIDALKSGG